MVDDVRLDDMTLMRDAWAQIDLDAVTHNAQQIRALVPSHVLLMGVLKANAYGHGAVEVAHTLVEAGYDAFAVATLQEGVALRKAGITQAILLLSQPPLHAIPLLVEHEIMPTVNTVEFAIELGEAALSTGKCASYNLKIDTGMSRFGLQVHEVIEFLDTISFHRALKLWGTFTHFATVGTVDWPMQDQLKRFEQCLALMRDAGYDPGIVHAANSAATILCPQTHFNMVRTGIALYGLHPCEQTRSKIDLQPVMSIRARALQVKHLPTGTAVSYGRLAQVNKPTDVVVIPLGYADGLPRRLSGKMDVLHCGLRMPQQGAICMDACMAFVQHSTPSTQRMPAVEPGDELVIVGKQMDGEITMDELAHKAGTISYELMCSLGRRLNRVYIKRSGAYSPLS